MKSMQKYCSAFFIFGWLCLALLFLDFFLSAPHYDGILSDTAEVIFTCCSVTFFTAAAVLRAVKKALEEK